MRLWDVLKGDVVSSEKYAYLKNKYDDLVIEFRTYREKAERREHLKSQLIKDLKKQAQANSEMWLLALPYIVSGLPMKNSDKVKIKEIARESGIIGPI